MDQTNGLQDLLCNEKGYITSYDTSKNKNFEDSENDDQTVANEFMMGKMSADPTSPNGNLTDTIDKGEEADAESDMEETLPIEENFLTNEETGRKRKKQDPNKRKKIRKMLTEDKLNKETLAAVQEEQERQKRLGEQAQQRALIMEAASKQASVTSPTTPDADPHSFLARLLTASDRNFGQIGLSKNLPQVPTPPKDDVICISSDTGDEESSSKPNEAIDLSSDNSDDVICTGEVKDEDPGMEEVNNSGMHSDDTLNQPDAQGRVLVNVSRPSNEPEIFLAPQLAKAVMPHQIGGIRFMFDNLVETLSHYETSNGFGCILAHAMGLGKTLQVIAFVDVFLRYTKARTVLCVVPVNTLLNWVAEFDMWLPRKSKCVNENPALVYPRSFSVHVLTESHKTVESRSKVVSQWYDEGGILLVGYEMYRLLASRKSRQRRTKKNKGETTINLDERDRISSLQSGMQDSLLKPGPDLIICDEGHRIKNSHANISKVLKDVRTKRRLVLTGYPLQNNLLEYWCMVDFVRPSFLGTKQEFANMFERPILNGQCADSTKDDIRLMRFRSHVLHSLLKGFVQRRSHSVLRNNLPLKEEHVLMVRMSQWQKKLYNTFISRNMEGGSGSWGSTVNPIRAFSICCKIWNHPDVLYRTVQEKTDKQDDLDVDLPDSINPNSSQSNKSPPNRCPISQSQDSNNGTGAVPSPATSSFSDEKEKGISYDWAKDILSGYTAGYVELSGKMVILQHMIQESVSRGDRLLVFSQSLSTLTLIEEFLGKTYVPTQSQEPRTWSKNESYFRLDGNTHSADRERMINHFNSPNNENVWLFLLSTRAGCLGINLIGANRVIVFDASWNPCHDAQAVCRVYRYGQQKTCHIYRLICDQSMEKKIYDRQVSKQGMSDRVVDKLNPASVFTKQEVLKLLEYSHEELPQVEIDDIDEYLDPVLRETCTKNGGWLTRKPFQHESLLLDCKDQRLTKAEKRMAHKGYQRDKMASSTYNYGRPSYAGFHNAPSINGVMPKAASTNNMQRPFFPSTMPPHGGARPIANVRPMQSTPLPMQGTRQNSQYQRAGVAVQKIVATQEIPLPPLQANAVMSSAPVSTSIKVGETYCIIRGRKGTYIRTLGGRIFAVRSNDSPRQTSMPQSSVDASSSPPILPTTSDISFRRNKSEPTLRREPPQNVIPPSAFENPSSQDVLPPANFYPFPPPPQVNPVAPLPLLSSSSNVTAHVQQYFMNESSKPLTHSTDVTNSLGLSVSSGANYLGLGNSYMGYGARNMQNAVQPETPIGQESHVSVSPPNMLDQLLKDDPQTHLQEPSSVQGMSNSFNMYGGSLMSTTANNGLLRADTTNSGLQQRDPMPFSSLPSEFSEFSDYFSSFGSLSQTNSDVLGATTRDDINQNQSSLREDEDLLDLSQKSATFQLGF